MYKSFYGLTEKPFSLLPDPNFLFMSKIHNMALTMLQYGLLNQVGITVITGDVGAGKTTLIRKLLSELDNNLTVGLISNTHESFGELMEWVAMSFGLEYKNKEKVALYDTFIDFVISEYAKSRRTVLIIDEAQNLSPSTMEELRMLSNINTDKDQILQLVLVGQPELRKTLMRHDLRQFAQRISADYHLKTLNKDEVKEYIYHRISIAGGEPDIFQVDACDVIWKASNGVPRIINTLCDTAFVYGYAEQIKSITCDIVLDVIRDKKKGGIFT
ncbi:MAG: AAA family ATPase [Gammaproteobacteria bacterium]|nr:AAA family ATPase [Gammaproteobacteria bacterium]